ncbi:MAG: pyridoxamine 5'-phosphate oxidase [Actinomycetota bacterium]
MPEQRDLRDLRVHYDRGTLSEADLAPSPLQQFRAWFAEAAVAGLAEANAMVVATVSADGVPSARTVLLKDVDARGFAFYTNLSSRKGTELTATRRASLVFPWYDLHRQVVVVGETVEVPRDEAADYFSSRPRESRIGAWTSHQSRVIADRSVLDERYAELVERFPGDVPLPDFWGGWIVVPETVEFWQGRESRLHDRLRYRRTRADALLDDADAWVVERLSP